MHVSILCCLFRSLHMFRTFCFSLPFYGTLTTAAIFSATAQHVASGAEKPRSPSGNVWTTYEFGNGTDLHGLGLGLGIRAPARREATLPNSFYFPGYVRLASVIWYKFSAHGQLFRDMLYLRNLTNARIYDTNGTFWMRAEAPRSALGSLQVVF